MQRFKIWRLMEEGRFNESNKAIDFYISMHEERGTEIPVPAKIAIITCRGLNAIAQGKPDAARRSVEEMDALLSSPSFEEYSYLARMVRRMPILLEAEVLLSEGRPAKAIVFMAAKDTMYTPTLTYDKVGFYNIPFKQDVVARAHVALGDKAGAIEEYERMLILDPADADRRMRVPVYHYRVAVLYEKEGQYDLAAKNYERYLDIMKRADEGIAEVEDARRRLEKLRRSSSVIRSSSSPRMTGEK